MKTRISDDIFKCIPFDTYKKRYEDQEEYIQDHGYIYPLPSVRFKAVREVQAANSIIESHERRKAAEKRKAEKASAKASAKPAAAKKTKTSHEPTPAKEEPVQEEWPEDDDDDDFHEGQESDDSNDPDDVDGEDMGE
eukprot:s436_g52.t1